MDGKTNKTEGGQNEIVQILVSFAPQMNTINRMVFLGLGLTTIYTVYNSTLPRFENLDFLGNFGIRAAATILTLYVYHLLDGDLRKNVVQGMRAVISGDWKKSSGSIKSMAAFFFIVAIGRLVLSGGATVVSSILLGDDLVEDGDTAGVEAMVQKRAENKALVIHSYDTDISEARRSERSRVNDADRRGKAMVEAAIKSGTPSQQDMWKSNPGFFTSLNSRSRYYKTNSDYYARITAAQAEAKRMVEEERGKVTHLQESKDLAVTQVATDTAETILLKIKEKQIAKAGFKEALITTSLTIVDLCLLIFALLTSRGIAIVMPLMPNYQFFDETPKIGVFIWEALMASYRIVVNFVALVASKIDDVGAAFVDEITDGEGVLSMFNRDIQMQRAEYRGRRGSRGQADTNDTNDTNDTSSGSGSGKEAQDDTGGASKEAPKAEKPRHDSDTGRKPIPEEMTQEEPDPAPDPAPKAESPDPPPYPVVVEVEQMSPEEMILMVKRVRRRWERSWPEGKDAPVAGSKYSEAEAEEKRQELRSAAEDEIETLTLLGYKVKQNKADRTKLDVDKPPVKRRKYKA